MRQYTTQELDALRYAVEMRWLCGTSRPGNRAIITRSYTRDEKLRAVEDLTRTHMLAGHTAADLFATDEHRIVERGYL